MITVNKIYPHVVLYHKNLIYFLDGVSYSDKEIKIEHSKKVSVKEKIKRITQSVLLKFYSNLLKKDVVLYKMYNIDGFRNKFVCHINYNYITKDLSEFHGKLCEITLQLDLLEWIDTLDLKL